MSLFDDARNVLGNWEATSAEADVAASARSSC